MGSTVKAETVDALVVGGGPAGLGAALALCRQMHTVVVFDSGVYRNRAASKMHMVATWDHRSPREFLSAARAELKARYPDQCTFINREVRSITQVPVDGVESQSTTASQVFSAEDVENGTWRGRKVVLASGVRDLLPALDGIDDCWGHGVVHCLLCKGHEQRNAESVGILALDDFSKPSTVLRVLRSCRRFAKSVRVYTNGNTRVAAQLQEVVASVSGCEIEPAYIERLEMVDSASKKDEQEVQIVLEDDGGSHVHAFAVYHAGTEQASPLAEELGIELDDSGDIKPGVMLQTSVQGVFAAGDCVSAEKFVSVASSTGFMAGAGVAQQLQAETKY